MGLCECVRDNECVGVGVDLCCHFVVMCGCVCVICCSVVGI